MQMVDIHLPTMDGRRLILSRYTQPDQDQKLLLHRLDLNLPKQSSPRIATITLTSSRENASRVVPTF